jgi:murein L,D-transpeptidase YafK
VVVDTRKSALYLYQNANGQPRFVADYYISHGKAGTDKLREGDKKTPIGVYHVTASLPRQKLTDFYGSGAFPISYPNEWDKRQGRNGHGIWLHGTPSDTFSRPPKASDGCVVLANQDLDALAKNLQIGLTPVIISNSIEWLSLDDWQAERRALLDSIEAWRQTGKASTPGNTLPTTRSASGRGRMSSSGRRRSARSMPASNGSRWRRSTSACSATRARKSWWSSPFDQDYRSSNLSNAMKKRQYWIKEDGAWKIIYEGAPERAPAF